MLRAGKVLAVFPEGLRSGGEVAWAKGGAAYLAMVSGAPIVPVAILGTREPGQSKNQVPRLRRPIHLVYGEPFIVPAISMAAPQSRSRRVDRSRTGAPGRSRSRCAGADRATLAGATEDQNPPSAPV